MPAAYAAQPRSLTATIAMPGGDIHAFCEPEIATSTSHRPNSKGRAPIELTPSTRMVTLGMTPRAARASAVTSFVTPVEVSLWVSDTALNPGFSRSARPPPPAESPSPTRPEAHDVRAERLGDSSEALAKHAGSDRQYRLARRQHVDHRGFLGTGSGAGQQQRLRGRAEERLEVLQHLAHDGGELRAAMVDHGPRARSGDGVGNRRRAGYAKIRVLHNQTFPRTDGLMG